MFADWLAEALRKSGLSQSDLAVRLEARLERSVDRSIVNKMVKGAREISAAELYAIAEETGHPLPQPVLPPDVARFEGNVGAGGDVEWFDPSLVERETLPLPDGARTVAFRVRGESQYPRFLDGEVLLVEAAESNPADLIGRYAVIQTGDGRRLIKIVRRDPRGGVDRWRLESHNAPPEDGVFIVSARRYLGTLADGSQASAFRLKRR